MTFDPKFLNTPNVTHLMIIISKYHENPSRRIREAFSLIVDGYTDRQTDRHIDTSVCHKLIAPTVHELKTKHTHRLEMLIYMNCSCHLKNFVPIFARGQNGLEGVVEKVDVTSTQNVLIMLNFPKM